MFHTMIPRYALSTSASGLDYAVHAAWVKTFGLTGKTNHDSGLPENLSMPSTESLWASVYIRTCSSRERFQGQNHLVTHSGRHSSYSTTFRFRFHILLIDMLRQSHWVFDQIAQKFASMALFNQ